MSQSLKWYAEHRLAAAGSAPDVTALPETLRNPDFGTSVTWERVALRIPSFVPLPESDAAETGGPREENRGGLGGHQTLIEAP